MSTKFCGQLRVRHKYDKITHDYIFDMKKFTFNKGDDDSDNLLIVEVDEETSMLRMLANENKSLEREIVALLNDLSGDCDSCEHNDECEDYPRNCVEGDRWEWRGIVEVEKGAKHDK